MHKNINSDLKIMNSGIGFLSLWQTPYPRSRFLLHEVEERHREKYKIQIDEIGIYENHAHMVVKSGMNCSPAKLTQLFKGYTSRMLTGLSRNQIYYRLSKKFGGFFGIKGRIWRIKAMGHKLIQSAIDYYGKAIGLWHHFLYNWQGIILP